MFRKVLMCGSVFFMLSCTQNSSVPKDALIVAVPTEAVSLFPYNSNDNASARVNVQIYNRLVEKNEDGEFIPSLAEEWEFISPTVLQMKLRSGVKFHNGAILSAQDVKYSLERMLVSPEVNHIASPIKNVSIIDDNTININLKAEFAPILAHLNHPVSSIVNEKFVKELTENVGQVPMGTGPYKLSQWNRGQNIVLERFNEYWDGAAKLAKIEFRVVPEATARTIALETGDVDIAYDIDPIDRNRLSENSKLQLIERSIARIEYLGFNINKGANPIWKDKRVREAVAYAIDIKGIIDSVLFGAGTPAASAIYSSVFGYYDDLSPRVQDLEKAKQLLAEAGVQPGTKVTMWSTEGQRQKILEVIQANLREIGLNASIEVFEWARFLDGTAKGEHDLFILGWTTITGDADYGLYNLLHTDAWGAAGNRSFYSNPLVDQALDMARQESDPVKRAQLYKDVQIIVYEDIPIIPLYYKLSTVGILKNIQGFVFDSTDAHQLNSVYIQ